VALEDTAHLARYCKPGDVTSEGGPKVSAFYLRLPNGVVEDYLSCSWLEFLGDGTPDEQVRRLRDFLMQSRFDELEMKATGRLARFNVGTVRQRAFDEHQVVIRAEHEPRGGKVDQDPHSGLYGLPHPDTALATALANLLVAISQTFPAPNTKKRKG
jgi:hypothetical protein